MTENSNKRRYFEIILKHEVFEKFLWIKNKYGFTDIDNTINYCINVAYAKERILSDNEVEGSPKSEKSAKEELATLPYPNGLAGTIFTKTGGGKWVKYYTYFNRDRMEAELPLEDVSKEIIDNQYIPSYEEIKSMQERGKVSY